MHFSKLVPNIFYVDIKDGLVTFVDCLQFSIVHDELKTARPFCVLAKGDITINLFQDAPLAREHNPEFRLVTDNIEEVYARVSASHPHLLHPNLSRITLRPWGAREFAITDKQLGIVVQQWT
ncbi:hypothetical protein [Emticicia sp. 21SJ11W-3]|uniref:hypothetical protein n=1 Tax=Emticicia sp. 21SJ11W-3 TaxID=2916755 RepID=UPI0020A17F27|nr:hypothetical protein [Emticicia sp. 21SJ11W-3]UTA66981.1 hypothetical protein MB380_15400 [Emticicia sp. 21SJ11W-3]